jgi:glutamate-1-semialdehyde 2,1-aminomutase
MSWGALILGHAHPDVLRAVKEVVDLGTSFGMPTTHETELGRMITDAFPSIELVRLVNSGTEAVMGAIRACRGFTGKKKVIKFSGCYHGSVDYLLVKAGSGAATFSVPDSLGVPDDFTQHTIVLPFNNLDAFIDAVREHKSDLAGVILEPIPGNMGVVPPKEGFLHGVRAITREHEIPLIFDEVITGFRVSYGGAQGYFGLTPDMTCLGKVIGGGFPIGAYGGRREIMECVSPLGGVYQAGTLSGNPVGVVAGIVTLRELSREGTYKRLEARTNLLFEGLKEAARQAKAKVFISKVSSMLCVFFTTQDVYDYDSAMKSDVTRFKAFFHEMLKQGIYLPPSQFETIFLSTAHTDDDIKQTVKAAFLAFKAACG